jgi:glycosyltransferase involved in cell wall biosynthesis
VGNFIRDRENILLSLIQAEKLKVKVFLVLDDANPNSASQAKGMVKDNAFRCVQIFQYSGRNPGGARNEGLRHVQTPWVQFCDSDDFIEISNTIQLLNSIDDTQLDAIVAGFKKKPDFKKHRIVDYVAKKSFPLGIILNPGIWRWLFRTEFVANLRFAETRMGEDQVFLAKCLLQNPEISNKQDYCVYTYNSEVPGSLSEEYSSEELEKTLREFELLSFENAKLRNSLLVFCLYFKMTLTRIRRTFGQSKSYKYGMYFSVLFRFLKMTFLVLTKRLGKLG